MLLVSILAVGLATMDFFFPLLIKKLFKMAQEGRHKEQAACSTNDPMYVTEESGSFVFNSF